MSQSPQIGSMFLTHNLLVVWMDYCKVDVAIPSNRVNVSYNGLTARPSFSRQYALSQSPQIGSMFLTLKINFKILLPIKNLSQSPQIGSMFLTPLSIFKILNIFIMSQSPQIGSMFLTLPWSSKNIPLENIPSRNPLKSGQCFLQGQKNK